MMRKQSPDMKKLEAVLRSSRLSVGGFLGEDNRSLTEIIDADLAELERLGYSPEQVAQRMRELTEMARSRFGSLVKVNDHLEVAADEHRGMIVCPWPHPAELPKINTTARRTDTGEELRWSALSVHMIEEHGFFEGRGSAFRIEPARLVRIIF